MMQGAERARMQKETDKALARDLQDIKVPGLAAKMLESQLGTPLPTEDAWQSMSQKVACVVAKSSEAFRETHAEGLESFASAERKACQVVSGAVQREVRARGTKLLEGFVKHLTVGESQPDMPTDVKEQCDAIIGWAPSASKLGLDVFQNREHALAHDKVIDECKACTVSLQRSFGQLAGTGP